MKRIVKVAAVSAAALGLVAGATPDDSAAGAVAFIGTAGVNPGLSAPPGPGQNGTWSLSNVGPLPNAGVGVSTTGDAGAATITANGSLHVGIVNVFGPGALCGLSGGSNGSGSITIGASTVNIDDVGWAQSAATVIAFSGDTVDGAGSVVGGLAGVVSAVPPIPGVIGAGSCAAGTATQFTVIGAGAATF